MPLSRSVVTVGTLIPPHSGLASASNTQVQSQPGTEEFL